ncbi:hypothetical protein P153DRAFT_220549 [Dothidotthia symphoricarpi CBS 119687]|uniref:F-box domain-containing protein n=1 Tax=Dothidotthia symphoricarpi CBS 119687 TaxID=1392245 RepID=A0A6A6AI50_9PLEO|nr:uncharacterized protein P153DRAFT_220549 [Dothidotthia symphoricarpi CBS 119687]KAF2130554.1 hypothetical protein P153DRAFT_220549 [Dothidotthia symphoricarpi CBS 119687]
MMFLLGRLSKSGCQSLDVMWQDGGIDRFILWMCKSRRVCTVVRGLGGEGGSLVCEERVGIKCLFALNSSFTHLSYTYTDLHTHTYTHTHTHTHTTMASLMDLPRELRDMIIDDVLGSLAPAPVPSHTDATDGEDTEPPSSIVHTYDTPYPRIPWHINPLLHTCAQLRVEVSQRAAFLKTPLVLDMLILSDGNIKSTFLTPLSRPLGSKIHMQVHIRVRPVKVRFYETRVHNETFRTVGPVRAPWLITFAKLTHVQRIPERVVAALKEAVLGVLFADGMSVSERAERAETTKCTPVLFIAEVRMVVQRAEGVDGKVLEIPHGEDPAEYYQPGDELDEFPERVGDTWLNGLLDIRTAWWCADFEREAGSLLARVGKMRLDFEGKHTREWKIGGLLRMMKEEIEVSAAQKLGKGEWGEGAMMLEMKRRCAAVRRQRNVLKRTDRM